MIRWLCFMSLSFRFPFFLIIFKIGVKSSPSIGWFRNSSDSSSVDRLSGIGFQSVCQMLDYFPSVCAICLIASNHLLVGGLASPTSCVFLFLYVVYVPVYSQYGCLLLWPNSVSQHRETPRLGPPLLVTVMLEMLFLPASPTTRSLGNWHLQSRFPRSSVSGRWY